MTTKNTLKMSRVWAMPNRFTFSIKPIRELIDRHIDGGVWLDPFSGETPFADKCVTNDLNPDREADHHLEALDFLAKFDGEGVDGVLFDPPYSPRQISECYNNIGRVVHQSDTQSSFYGDRKKAVASAVRSGGKVVSFAWNSGGIGKTNGFDIIEVLLVPHGGAHNDTIVTVEVKR